MVLPEDWAVPHLRPVAYARRLDLLGPGTLAVHGVQLEPAEVTALAASGSALCLCPRSNEYLAVGTASVAALLESGLLCCLGTDGLSSNTDLDVRQEAVFLRERLDVAPQALIRCLTVNGAAALGLAGYGRLEPGSRAVFSVCCLKASPSDPMLFRPVCLRPSTTVVLHIHRIIRTSNNGKGYERSNP